MDEVKGFRGNIGGLGAKVRDRHTLTSKES